MVILEMLKYLKDNFSNLQTKISQKKKIFTVAKNIVYVQNIGIAKL